MKPNIRLQAINATAYKIILCNETTLELDYIPPVGSCDDIVIQWPVNPHFTGKNGIASILQNYEQFKGKEFIC